MTLESRLHYTVTQEIVLRSEPATMRPDAIREAIAIAMEERATIRLVFHDSEFTADYEALLDMVEQTGRSVGEAKGAAADSTSAPGEGP